MRAVLTLRLGDHGAIRCAGARCTAAPAIGEQFIELTPQTGKRRPTARTLRDGDVIPVGTSQVPADIGSLLDATNRALQAIPQDNLRTVIDEADQAVGGLGPELSRIVDGSTALAIDGRQDHRSDRRR